MAKTLHNDFLVIGKLWLLIEHAVKTRWLGPAAGITGDFGWSGLNHSPYARHPVAVSPTELLCIASPCGPPAS